MEKAVIDQPKGARALARRAAIDAALAELRAYALTHGGRFLVFGSTATGHVGEHSDLDLMLDFPDDLERTAWLETEAICAAHDVPVDIHSLKWTTDKFLQRIGPHAFVVG